MAYLYKLLSLRIKQYIYPLRTSKQINIQLTAKDPRSILTYSPLSNIACIKAQPSGMYVYVLYACKSLCLQEAWLLLYHVMHIQHLRNPQHTA